MADDGGRIHRVTIPYAPRAQFKPFHDRAQRWAVIVAHRRAGKTVAAVNELLRAALTCQLKDPRVAYIAPFHNQAKDVAWTYLRQFASVIPGVEFNESELRADLPNGGRVRLYGADNYDRLRGIYLDAVVLDEYGDMEPRAWAEVIRPALADRKGWATFIGTPRGRNDFAKVWDDAAAKADWFKLMLKASETGLVADAELEDARRAMTAEQFAAEFECSFTAGVIGAIYGKEMEAAESDKRIGRAPHDPALPVWSAWDLGIGDATAIWMAQAHGAEVRVIDYIENNGVALDWYVRELDKRPYRWAKHLLPHDAQARELGTGRTRVETLESLGMNDNLIDIVPAMKVDDRINAARLMLPRCWFDADKCATGIDALRNYRSEWDDKRKTFNPRPRHDWASHAADAFGHLAVGIQAAMPERPREIAGAWSGGEAGSGWMAA